MEQTDNNFDFFSKEDQEKVNETRFVCVQCENNREFPSIQAVAPHNKASHKRCTVTCNEPKCGNFFLYSRETHYNKCHSNSKYSIVTLSSLDMLVCLINFIS